MKQKNILEFIHFCEKLKNEFRNGRTSTGKIESVAEHCWRVSMMAMMLSPYLNQPVSIEKALKISLIHDLAEAITGDIPYFCHEGQMAKELEKQACELEAIEKIKNDFDLPEEIVDLWKEFEYGSSYEGKFVRAIDKMEAQIQHNEADFNIWNEFDLKFAKTGLDSYSNFDSFLTEFKNLIQEESIKKIKENS